MPDLPSNSSSITSKEELNRPPPGDDIWCAVCGEEEEDGVKLLRCATCKNQFYCSAKCQTKDWKSHKHNCSLLPLGDLAYLAPLSEEQAQKLNNEVRRAAMLLHEWEQAFDAQGRAAAGEKAFRASTLPQSQLLLDLQFAPEYSSASYTRLPPEHQTHKYRTSIVLLARLFLIHLLTPSPSNPLETVDQLQRTLATWNLPLGPGAQVWGPKVACRPGDLSPGEYAQIATMMQTLNINEWFKRKGTDDAQTPAPSQSPQELAYARRLVNLAIVTKSLWGVKG